MGIPHLYRLLQPYATREEYHRTSGNSQPLSNGITKKAIIDGPSLAYHAHGLVNASRRSYSDGRSFFPGDAPATYIDAAASVIAQLEALEAHGFEVAAIFFDGALPAPKKPTRLARLSAGVRALRTLRMLYPTDESLATAMSAGSSSSSSSSNRFWATVPAPPFLVPAMIEVLMGGSSRFANVTRVVPGEADNYCVAFAREHGGMIFTSDSDLLAYDVGPSSLVAFHKDIELINSRSESSMIKADVFHVAEIARRLGLSTLQPLAFAIRQDHYRGIGECLIHAKRLERESTIDYREFLEEYWTPKRILELEGSDSDDLLTRLDPRISEWVQMADINGAAEARPAEVDMFLPFLIEDIGRSSAWTSAITIRQLAYSILRPSERNTCLTVEYYRKGNVISAVPVEHLQPRDVEETLRQLQKFLDEEKWSNGQSGATRWKLIGLLWLLKGLVDYDKGLPDQEDVVDALLGQSWRSWEVRQLCAQLQAVLYSFRLLTQCFEVFDACPSPGSLEVETVKSSVIGVRFSLRNVTLPELCDPVHQAEYRIGLIDIVRKVYSSFGLGGESEVKRPKERNKLGKVLKNDREGQGSITEQVTSDSSNMYSILSSIEE